MEINLHPEESILTQSLKNKIVEKIGTNYISVSDFMGLALYQKDYGYYNNLLHKFGEAGDFITAPMVSSVFASCIANQFKELFYAQAAQELEKLCQFTYNQAQGSSTFYSDLRALASKVHSLLALLAARKAPVN